MEFAAALAELRTDPEGWRSFTRAGRRTFHDGGLQTSDPVPASWERVGDVDYPDFFEVTAWETDRRDGLVFVAGFELWRGDFELVGFWARGLEVPAALERASAVPGGLGFWKRRALLLLAAFGSNAEGVSGPDSIDVLLAPVAREEAWHRARQSLELPNSNRRDRVTVAVLEEAASIYRDAYRAGQNPTQAVAGHFHKSHSTAARWVGQARKLGLLGPADGSRGGEVVDPHDDPARRAAAVKLSEQRDG